MPSRGILTDVDRLELAAQEDMMERGRRLAEFHAKTDGKVWRYHEDIGQWLLVPVVDGTVHQPDEQAA